MALAGQGKVAEVCLKFQVCVSLFQEVGCCAPAGHQKLAGVGNCLLFGARVVMACWSGERNCEELRPSSMSPVMGHVDMQAMACAASVHGAKKART